MGVPRGVGRSGSRGSSTPAWSGANLATCALICLSLKNGEVTLTADGDAHAPPPILLATRVLCRHDVRHHGLPSFDRPVSPDDRVEAPGCRRESSRCDSGPGPAFDTSEACDRASWWVGGDNTAPVSMRSGLPGISKDGNPADDSPRRPRCVLRLGRTVAIHSCAVKPIAAGGGAVLGVDTKPYRAFGARGVCQGAERASLSIGLQFRWRTLQRVSETDRRCRYRSPSATSRPDIERISTKRLTDEGLHPSLRSPEEIAEPCARARTELSLPISTVSHAPRHPQRSRRGRPDGLVVVDPLTELGILHKLPVGLMGRRPATEARLASGNQHHYRSVG